MRDWLIGETGADVTLTPGHSGAFEITVDGALVFSKKSLGRFPRDAELSELLGQ